jgi:ethanolamine utilization protein EutQ (cupin superfamily)
MEVAYAAKAKTGQTARNVALADYMHAPDIHRVDVSGYHGQPGDVIRIEVTDDFAVVEVKVVITNTDGSIVEEGYAKPEATGYEWTYTATVANASLEGDRIEVYASDTPGNIAKAEADL